MLYLQGNSTFHNPCKALCHISSSLAEHCGYHLPSKSQQTAASVQHCLCCPCDVQSLPCWPGSGPDDEKPQNYRMTWV